jgi:dihydrofolate reductase
MGRRKIIVYIATSADGYIARKDGTFDWLDRPRPKRNYGGEEFFRTIDTILWGRKTLDVAMAMGGLSIFGPKVRNYVFTRTPPVEDPDGVEYVREPIEPFVKRLRAAKGKHIWMMGGAGIIASFLDAGAIDEFIIHVVPVMIGEGIPLVEPANRLLDLKLLSTDSYPNGIVRLHYSVRPPAGAKKSRKPAPSPKAPSPG